MAQRAMLSSLSFALEFGPLSCYRVRSPHSLRMTYTAAAGLGVARL